MAEILATAETPPLSVVSEGVPPSVANGVSHVNGEGILPVHPAEPIIARQDVSTNPPETLDPSRERPDAPQPGKPRPNKFQELLSLSIEAKLRREWEEAKGELNLLRMTPEERQSEFTVWAAEHRPHIDLKEARRALLRFKRQRAKQKKEEGDYLRVLRARNVDLTPYEDSLALLCKEDPRAHLRRVLWDSFLQASDVGRGRLLPPSQALTTAKLSETLATIPLHGFKGRRGVIELGVSGRLARHRITPVITFTVKTWFLGWRKFANRPRSQSLAFSLGGWVGLTTSPRFLDKDGAKEPFEPMEVRHIIEVLSDQESEELSTTFVVQRPDVRGHLRFVARTNTPYIGVKYVDDCDTCHELWGVLGGEVHRLFLPWIQHPGFASSLGKGPDF